MPDSGMPSWSEFNLAYWSARIALVIAWLWIARQVWIQSTRTPHKAVQRYWQWAGLIATWLAVLRATRIDWRIFQLLQNTSPELHDGFSQILLGGIGLAGAAIVLWFCLAAFNTGGMAAPLTILTCSLMLLFTFWETFSVDELIPASVRQQPGRYMLEGTFAFLAAMASWKIDRGELVEPVSG